MEEDTACLLEFQEFSPYGQLSVNSVKTCHCRDNGIVLFSQSSNQSMQCGIIASNHMSPLLITK